MYSYTFDEETGGILLNSTPTGFSKEPRVCKRNGLAWVFGILGVRTSK